MRARARNAHAIAQVWASQGSGAGMDCLAFLAREVQRGVAERVDSRRIRAAAEQVRRDVHVAVVRRVPAAVWRAWGRPHLSLPRGAAVPQLQ